MILEKIVALQIESFFEENKLFGSFQFGFRNKKSTISEMLTVFDTLLEEKEKKKEIMLILYDLSSAFDTVNHEILLTKLQLYGLNEHAIKWMKSYLQNRKQIVTVCGKFSSAQDMETGTPQGSRLSPLLFICLMADMDLWTNQSLLSNFADDTQSLISCDSLEEAIETTKNESNSVISFFESNHLVNNANKAAILHNSNGKGKDITIENIGGEKLKSTHQEKLLGLHINSNFEWNTHIEKITIDLKKRLGLLKRIRNRIPRDKLVLVAEAIFNSKIRYGIAVYLNPVFEKEDLKAKKLSKNTTDLQVLQNTMIRMIFGLKTKSHINMMKLRERIKMMSVNQMCIYHNLLEAYNVVKNSSSEQIKLKWENKNENQYQLRSSARNDTKIPKMPRNKCKGFSYFGAKLLNLLPCDVKATENSNTFKAQIKQWIWQNIPSY